MEEKKIYETLIHYNYTDELFDYLKLCGRIVYRVHYGYYNELDLIVWGE